MLGKDELFRIDSLSLYEDSPPVKRRQSKCLKQMPQQFQVNISEQSYENSNPLTIIEYSKSSEIIGSEKQKMIFEKYTKATSNINQQKKRFFKNQIKEKADQIRNTFQDPEISLKKRKEKNSQQLLFSQMKRLRNKLRLLIGNRKTKKNLQMNKAESCIIEQIKSLQKQINVINKAILEQNLKNIVLIDKVKTEENLKIIQDSPFSIKKEKNNDYSFKKASQCSSQKLIPQYLNIGIFTLLVLACSIIYAMISCVIKF